MGYQAKSLARYYQMQQHPVTPATRALWPWDRVIVDTVSGIDMTNGTQPHFLGDSPQRKEGDCPGIFFQVLNPLLVAALEPVAQPPAWLLCQNK